MSEEISFDEHEITSRKEESKKEYQALKKKGMRGFIAGMMSKFIGNVMTKKSYQIPTGIVLIYTIGVGLFFLFTTIHIPLYLIIILSVYYASPFIVIVIKNSILWLKKIKKKQ